MFARSVCITGLFLAALTVSVGAQGAEKNLVLVELFTSEGCSSCPPADRLLTTLHTTQPFADATVVALAYHVDYWDKLGWKDPFADKTYTLRQQAYAGIHKEERVYTPQMMVNGVTGFVGSDRGRAMKAIQDPATRPRAQLKVSAKRKGDAKTVEVAIESDLKPVPGVVLWIALAEDGLRSEVTGGENKGKNMVHQAVVRSYTRYDIAETDLANYTVSLPWKEEWNPKAMRVVAGVQSESLGAVAALGQGPVGASE